jgi:hypothetical protein
VVVCLAIDGSKTASLDVPISWVCHVAVKLSATFAI